ncbi:MAG: adenosylcobalamin-dependent ribonucleoside-diphosphate reductase [Bacteroidetes bacterium]|nr:adenosylcobalamin-dependent ribonucleoside-diphosphate reductase [Bacteroidota bacterium]
MNFVDPQSVPATSVQEKTAETTPETPTPLNYDDVLKASTKYFDGDELAATVWINKYALKDSEGNVFELSPADMHHRMASEIARVETKYKNPMSEKEIYALFENFKYIVPQGGPMSGIGNNFQKVSLSNCFVIGNKSDSYGGIMRTDEEQVQLMKRRGGVGHDLSHIRPKGSPVKNSAITSTGLVPFMERYSNSTREVAQDGRRGALMLSVSIKHPDAGNFISAKLEQGKITGANISVRIDDDFMKAAMNEKPYTQQYPVKSDKPKITKEIDAKKLWGQIVHNAWKSAEPGILFWDTVLRESVPDCYADLGYETVSTNPCGEIPLCPYDSCRLLAINLYSYVDAPFTKEASFNFPKFKKHVGYAQRIMDNIIDLEIEKIDDILNKIQADPEAAGTKINEYELWEKIKVKCIEGRRTGVGITAEGDMLAAMGLRYGSDKAIEFSENLHKQLAVAAYRSSVELAKDRGPFTIYNAEKEKDNPFINRLKKEDPSLYEDMVKYGRRNIALLTIAPTGTTSLMTQTSSGLEPVFLVSYKRRRKVNPNDKDVNVSFVDETGDHWEEYNVFHHKFLDYLKINGHDVEATKSMDEEELKALIEKSPFNKATANDIDWVQKVKMQGAVQKWVDHSISVTVNIPNETTEELVSQIYETAWKEGCKGVTVYRDGSRSGVLVSNDDKGTEEKVLTGFNESKPPKRPKTLEAEVIRFQNDYEKWIAVVGLLEGKPYEVFTGRAEDTFMLPTSMTGAWIIKNKDDEGNNRYDFKYKDKDGYNVTLEGLSRSFDKEFWNYAKLISGVLRHGMPLLFAIDLISELNLDSTYINTWKNGVVRALKKFIPDGTVVEHETCSSCGDPDGLVYREGCLICKSCGYSKCG